MLYPCKFALRKNIPDFPLYTVDNYGEVINLNTHKVLSWNYGERLYSGVTLIKRGEPKSIRERRLVHRLVLSTFKGWNSEKTYVDHIDNNPLNNDLTNLRWVTQSENIKRAYDQGRAKSPKAGTGKFGALHPRSKAVAGYDENGKEIIRFAGLSEARRSGYHPCKQRGFKSRGITFKYI